MSIISIPTFKNFISNSELEKSEVRKIASDIGLVTADKKDSQSCVLLVK